MSCVCVCVSMESKVRPMFDSETLEGTKTMEKKTSVLIVLNSFGMFSHLVFCSTSRFHPKGPGPDGQCPARIRLSPCLHSTKTRLVPSWQGADDLGNLL